MALSDTQRAMRAVEDVRWLAARVEVLERELKKLRDLLEECEEAHG